MGSGNRPQNNKELRRYSMEWTKTTEGMPEPGIVVLACIRAPRYNNTPDVNKVIIRVVWYPQWFEVSDVEDDCCEYSEEKDEYYLLEGWYEWNQEEETHYRVSDPVSHWMPLPNVPGL
jgi:hypothetical protein